MIRHSASFLAGLAVVALTAQPPTPNLHEQDFRPLLVRPAFARTVSKPFVPLLVELLWLRALNAIGNPDNEQKNRALYEYGLVITDLDPRFKLAYEFIGLNIPYAVARNTWAGGDLACDVFRRGLKVFPTDLRLHLYLGFSLMHHQRKFAEASEVFARASRLPDALAFMAPLATRLKAHSGAPEEALEMTREMLKSDLDETLRAEMESRAQELEVEIVLQQVDRASVAYLKAYNVHAKTTLDLRNAGLYDGPLVDPLGGLISLEEDGKATSTSLKRRLEIYE